MRAHPPAQELLTNTLAEAFANRTVHLYYFYSNDEAAPRAAHYYPTESAVHVTIREDQEPIDEFICLLFELINSEGEVRFQDVARRAKSGTVSRADFAQEVLKTEFEATKRTRDLLENLKFTKRDKSSSYYYKLFAECPNRFDDFLLYTREASRGRRDPIEELQEKYDALQKP